MIKLREQQVDLSAYCLLLYYVTSPVIVGPVPLRCRTRSGLSHLPRTFGSQELVQFAALPLNNFGYLKHISFNLFVASRLAFHFFTIFDSFWLFFTVFIPLAGVEPTKVRDINTEWILLFLSFTTKSTSIYPVFFSQALMKSCHT